MKVLDVVRSCALQQVLFLLACAQPLVAADYVLPALPAEPALAAPGTPGSVAMGDPATFNEAKMDFPIRSGPFQPTWDSIAAHYPAPQPTSWLRAAKFGIWVHYGPQSSLNSGDWSAQHMYQQGSDPYNNHLSAFGHPTVSGYKDVLRAWNPVNYSPRQLAQLYYNSGVRFVLVQGAHHDNFDNWNSTYNPWNMMNFGAKRDTMAEWKSATQALNMRMGVAFHHEYSWWFYQPAYRSDSTGSLAGSPYDAQALLGSTGTGTWWQGFDLSRLYNTNLREYSGIDTPTSGYWNPTQGIFVNHLDYAHWYATQWALRMIDVIEKYDPDFIYTDGNSTGPFTGYATSTGYKCDAVQRVIAHFYNKAQAEQSTVDKMSFIKFHYPANGVATTTESGYPAGIKVDQAWATDLTIGPWFWQSGLTFDNGATMVHMLLETASRDGSAIINIPIDGTGSLAGGAPAMLSNVGQWMTINGEGIYGSRAWSTYREGTGDSGTSDIRYTVGANGFLYAYCMTVPAAGTQLNLGTLGTNSNTLSGPITSVSLLGSNATLAWSQSATGLTITCPSTMPSVAPGTSVCFKIGSPVAIGGQAPINLAAQTGAGQVNLTWTYSIFAPAATFSVKRASSATGPYTTLASGLAGTTFTDTTGAGALYYYTVTAVSAAGESAPAPYASATAAGSVSSNWVSQDVGSVGATGSFGQSNGTLTVKGAGADIWDTADAFRFTAKAARGDCSVTARIVSIQNTNSAAKAGVMIRTSLDPSSVQAITDITAANGLEFLRRTTTGGTTGGVAVGGPAAPYWVRLTRVGNVFTSYYSADGVNWTNAGNVTIAMPETVFVGTVVCSHVYGTLCQAVFDNVTTATNVHLPFDETSGVTSIDTSDNQWNATLAGGAGFTAGKFGNALSLNGTTAYASLPAGVASGMNDFTVAAWVKLNSVTTSARLIDFGTGTTTYLVLVPKNSVTNVVRFAITTGGSSGEQIIDGSAPLSTGAWMHVAVTRAGNTGTLYVNGAVVGTTTNLTLSPASLGTTTNNYLGKSQSSGDPYLNGQIDEFQILPRALTAAQIAALIAPPAAPSVNGTPGNAQATLSWTAVSGATGYNIRRGASSGGPYTLVGWQQTGPGYVDTGLNNGATYYYVVSTVNGATESSASSEVAVSLLLPPAAPPTSVSATVSSTQIRLNWLPSSNATSYVVSRAPASNGAYAAVGTVTGTTFTDVGLANGTTYYYVISAVNVAGSSADYSSEAAVTTWTAFQQWNVSYGLAYNTPASATPDGDGISLLMKYAVGLTPGVSATNPTVVSSANGHLNLSFNRVSPAPVNYFVQASNDLFQWVTIADLTTGTDTWTGSATVSGATSGSLRSTIVEDTVSISANQSRFLRLMVSP